MKARQARKIAHRQFNRIPEYWWRRIIDWLDGQRKDHRVSEATRMYNKIRRKEE